MKAKQLLLVVILVGAIGAFIVNLDKDKNVIQHITPATVQLPIEGELPSLDSATEWLNSEPLGRAVERGQLTFDGELNRCGCYVLSCFLSLSRLDETVSITTSKSCFLPSWFMPSLTCGT